MANLYDFAYAVGLAIAAPFWLIKPSARRKVLAAFRSRMGRDLPTRLDGPAVLIHAVSVGEVNVTPALIAALRQRRADLRFIVSTTTETGTDRARQLFAGHDDVTLIRYPLDFSGAISRVLDRVAPSVVVLMELELWPNFMLQCRKRAIPVVVANGRITPPSFARYNWAGLATRPMFRRLAAAAVQDDVYAAMFRGLGTPAERVHVLGTMKFDSATLADRIDGDAELASAVGLRPGAEPIWVCGSTGPGEEKLLLGVYRRLLARHPALRLAIIPRHPPRFDDVAAVIQSEGFVCVRRSTPETTGREPQPDGGPQPVVLGDTMGELRKFYGLASVVFVGRSLVDLGPRQHGSDMIEPAALAKPVIVGPFTRNFDMPVRLLRDAGALVEVLHDTELFAAVDQFLSDRTIARETGRRAQEQIRIAQGSTARHAELIAQQLSETSGTTKCEG